MLSELYPKNIIKYYVIRKMILSEKYYQNYLTIIGIILNCYPQILTDNN